MAIVQIVKGTMSNFNLLIENTHINVDGSWLPTLIN